MIFSVFLSCLMALGSLAYPSEEYVQSESGATGTSYAGSEASSYTKGTAKAGGDRTVNNDHVEDLHRDAKALLASWAKHMSKNNKYSGDDGHHLMWIQSDDGEISHMGYIKPPRKSTTTTNYPGKTQPEVRGGSTGIGYGEYPSKGGQVIVDKFENTGIGNNGGKPIVEQGGTTTKGGYTEGPGIITTPTNILGGSTAKESGGGSLVIIPGDKTKGGYSNGGQGIITNPVVITDQGGNSKWGYPEGQGSITKATDTPGVNIVKGGGGQVVITGPGGIAKAGNSGWQTTKPINTQGGNTGGVINGKPTIGYVGTINGVPTGYQTTGNGWYGTGIPGGPSYTYNYGKDGIIGNYGNNGIVGPNYGNKGIVGPNYGNKGIVGPIYGNKGLVVPNYGNKGLVGPNYGNKGIVGPYYGNAVGIGGANYGFNNYGPEIGGSSGQFIPPFNGGRIINNQIEVLIEPCNNGCGYTCEVAADKQAA